MKKKDNDKLEEWISLARAAKNSWRVDSKAIEAGELLATTPVVSNQGLYIAIKDNELSVGKVVGDNTFEVKWSMLFTSNSNAWKYIIEKRRCGWLPVALGTGWGWKSIFDVD